MAYEDLKAAIKQAIKQNGNQEITGDLLQSTLLNIVNIIEKTVKTDVDKKIDKASIVQESGTAIDKIMSQGASINSLLSIDNILQLDDLQIANINILDPSTLIDNTFINNVGVLTKGDTNYLVTDFIPINKYIGSLVASEANGNIITKESIRHALYDTEKNYIQGSATNISILDWQEGAAYARFTFVKDMDRQGRFQIEIGRTPSKYIAYNSAKKIIKKDYKVDVENAEFLQLCNLLNPNTIKQGYFISRDGTEQVNENYFCSDFIPFTQDMQYLTPSINESPLPSGGWFSALYDINKNFIASFPSDTQTLVWQENVAFARFSFPVSHLQRKPQVEIGNTISKYYEYGTAKLKNNIKIKKENII